MTLLKWFLDKQLKGSIGKCHLLVIGKDEIITRLEDTEIRK